MAQRYQLEIDDIDEISAVDRPAQSPARAAIFKSADALNRLPAPSAGEAPEAFVARFTKDEAVIAALPDPAQRLAVALKRVKGTPLTGASAPGLMNPLPEDFAEIGKQGEPEHVTNPQNQPTLESVQKRLEETLAALEIQKSLASMNDAQRALYSSLPEAEKSNFLKASPEQRAERVRQAAEADKEVYKSLDGRSFRQSDDPRLVEMARSCDAMTRERIVEKAERQAERLQKRVSEEIPAFKGEVATKVALLKAVETLTESERAGVSEMLKAANAAMTMVTKELGTSTGGGDAGSAEAKLEKMATEYAAAHNVTVAKGWDAILQTDAGRALYAESQS